MKKPNYKPKICITCNESYTPRNGRQIECCNCWPKKQLDKSIALSCRKMINKFIRDMSFASIQPITTSNISISMIYTLIEKEGE